MQLLTEEIRARLPALGSQENEEYPVVQVKYFTPDAGWTWYATEGSPEGDDFVFFGYVQGIESEWGTFSLSELENVRGAPGPPVERDLYFRPCPVSHLMKGAPRGTAPARRAVANKPNFPNMGYLQDIDRWLDVVLTEVSKETMSVAELKRAIREKSWSPTATARPPVPRPRRIKVAP